MPNKNIQVVVVGRANVGKSTLFNRLIEKNKAIVSNVSGTTRDRNVDLVNWRDRQFTLIDTGGLDIGPAGKIEKEVVRQAEKAIADAALILFLIDVKAGVMPDDKKIAQRLVKQGLKNKTILVGNKADNLKLRQGDSAMYKLNLGEPKMVSAANGSGCGDLLDEIIKIIPPITLATATATDIIKVAIVGRPNVGKSSILNSILGEERVIVTDIAHTTRESHDIEFIYKDHLFILVDTAGLSKAGRFNKSSLEKKSMDKSRQAIEAADVVIFVTEAPERVKEQDKKITQEILAAGQSVVIVANKWDLIPAKDTNTIDKYKEYYLYSFPYLWWTPVIFTSAKDGLRTRKILDLIIEIQKSKQLSLTKSQLDKFLKMQIKRHRPSRGRGLKNPYLYHIEQVGTHPPRFIIYVNDPAILHFSYIRFLQNNLREQFKIIGTPIQIEVKKWIAKK